MPCMDGECPYLHRKLPATHTLHTRQERRLSVSTSMAASISIISGEAWVVGAWVAGRLGECGWSAPHLPPWALSLFLLPSVSSPLKKNLPFHRGIVRGKEQGGLNACLCLCLWSRKPRRTPHATWENNTSHCLPPLPALPPVSLCLLPLSLYTYACSLPYTSYFSSNYLWRGEEEGEEKAVPVCVAFFFLSSVCGLGNLQWIGTDDRNWGQGQAGRLRRRKEGGMVGGMCQPGCGQAAMACVAYINHG